MNKVIEKIKDDIWVIAFFGLAGVVILWTMLLPGYILTLDMIFTPEVRIFFEPGEFYNMVPFKFLVLLFSFVVPVWLIQKIILLSLFFLLGYLPYKFLSVPNNHGAAYFAGLFYVANPFVYERFLAGQYMLLFAYALLPVFLHLLRRFSASPSYTSSLKLFLILLLIGVFSLHLLVISVLVGLVYGLYRLIISDFKKTVYCAAVGSIVFLLLSSYWTVPYLTTSSSSNLASFGQDNWDAFATSSSHGLDALGNVLTLYGFWGEAYPWAGYFLQPRDSAAAYLIGLVGLAGLIGLGVVKILKSGKRKEGYLFLLLGAAGIVFSTGVGDSIFRPLNQWLFENVWFWGGFRDTQKWIVLLILGYVYFAGQGAALLLEKISRLSAAKTQSVVLIIFLLPVIYTYTIWGGFARQLQPVWYPQSWHDAKQVLDADSSEHKVLFLPWHQYMSLGFNQNIITQNPAKEFFGPKVIQGENVEIGPIYSQGGNKISRQIEDLLLTAQDSQQLLNDLADLNVKYIIVDNNFRGNLGIGYFTLEMLENSPKMVEKQEFYDNGNVSLTFFEILLR